MNWHPQDLRTLLLLLGAGFLIGWLFGQPGWGLFVGAVVFIVLQQREFRDFAGWSDRPLRRPANKRESWQDVGNSLFRSVARSRGRTHAALRQLRTMRTLAEAMPDAVVVIDGTGNIDQFNDAAISMLNLTRNDRGGNLASLVRQPDFVSLVRGQLSDNLLEFASPFAEGVRLEARRIDFDDDRALILVRDVTQLNRLLSMRQDFIANVSHELRTPLTVIVGYIETLISEDLDQETINALVQKLISPSRRMQALVDDLLLLTRLEASPTPLPEELVSIDMATLIDAVVADGRAMSQGKHQLEVSVEGAASVLGIESELHSACSNLVSNAVRYSPDGGTIEVSWMPVDGGARFSVRDHGIGIPAEHLSRITERFYRVDLARARIRGGTGLGLAIVKHVLKRHHSELRVESELGVGSNFYFDVPQRQLAEPSSGQREAGTVYHLK